MNKPKTICLVMIVKNEAKNLPRCFSTIKHIIDYWVIVDTGSTDNTQEVIQKELADIPGVLMERPWVNFGHNRSESLAFAKNRADYLLLCDADEQIIPTHNFDKSELTLDQYHLRYNGSLDYMVPYLIKSNLAWRFVGVTHEFLTASDTKSSGEIKSLSIKDWGDGGAKSDKFERDIKLLEQGLIDEPKNVRYMFYLANSYKNTKDFDNAIKWYKKRIDAGGWIEEVTCSYEYMGGCYQQKNDHGNAIKTWIDGYEFNPSRAECLYEAGKLLREENKNRIAYEFLQKAKEIPYPTNDRLFIKRDVYEYLIDYELTICTYYVKPEYDMTETFKRLIFWPSHLQQNIIQNFKFWAKDLNTLIGQEESMILAKDLISNDLVEGFTPSSPSILFHKNRKYINVRQVSYKIDENGKYLDRASGGHCKHVNTINTMYWTDGPSYDTENFKPNDISTKHVNGIEDLKLYTHNGVIKYTGTKWLDYNKISIVIGEYTKEGLDNYAILESPEGRNVEKNWVPFGLDNEELFVYDWNPIKIGRIKNNKLVIKNLKTSFPNLRGSAPGKLIGDHIYFLCHFVEYSTPRIYYHIFIKMHKDNWEKIEISKPFVFEKPQIEYSVGFDYNINTDDIHIAYSVNDSNARIKSYSQTQFQKLFT